MNKNIDKVLQRLFINGIILLFISIAFLISNIANHAKWYSYFFTIGIFSFSILFIIKSITMKKNHK